MLVWFLLFRSKLGFELRAVGFNRDAAEFSGINVNRNTLLAMTIAGAISGLAGAPRHHGHRASLPHHARRV